MNVDAIPPRLSRAVTTKFRVPNVDAWVSDCPLPNQTEVIGTFAYITDASY